MQTFKTIKSLKNFLTSKRQQNKTIGLIPTMGALHQGHASLINYSRRENDILVLSIFVNPKQFEPKEDFSKYPREEKKDKMFAQRMNVDIIFYPSEKEMYPRSFLTYVEVEDISRNLCGRFRPNHFRGVTTIVAKLLNIVEPSNLYLGQKDIQQAIILKKMVQDLNIPVRVKVCSTVREKSGLAISSRNEYLKEKQRLDAKILYKALKFGKQLMRKDGLTSKSLCKRIHKYIEKNSTAKIQYIECFCEENLKPVTTPKGRIVIAIAAYFGKTRLIDNIKFKI